MGVLLIAVSVCLYGLTGYLTYMNFTWFSGDEECNVNKNLIIFTIILQVIVTLLCKVGANSSLLTSGLICMYMWSLTWSGLTYGSEEKCNELMDSKKTYVVKLVFGIMCFIATITNNFFGGDI